MSAVNRGRHPWCGSTEKRNVVLLREKIARKEELCIDDDGWLHGALRGQMALAQPELGQVPRCTVGLILTSVSNTC